MLRTFFPSNSNSILETIGKQIFRQNQRILVGEISKSARKKDKMGETYGTWTFVGKDLETLFYFLIQYNVFFYCMTILYIFVLTFLVIATNKKKLWRKACKKTPLSPKNDSISPRNEINEEFAVREDSLNRVIGRHTRGQCLFVKKSYEEAQLAPSQVAMVKEYAQEISSLKVEMVQLMKIV
jgi:hypothetical protein